MKLLLVLTFLLSGLEAAYLPNESKLPIEFSDLIKSIQIMGLNKDEEKSFLSKLHKIDSIFGKIKKEDVYFLSKSEIYRVLLKNPPSDSFQADLVNPGILKKLQQVSTKFESSNPFLYWFAEAIRTDLTLLFEDPFYIQFKAMMDNTSQMTTKGSKFLKKFKLLIPWYDFISDGEPATLSSKLKPVLFKCMDAVLLKGTQLISFSNQTVPKPSKKLLFFRKGEIVLDTPRKRSIDDILSPIIEKNKKEGLPIPVSDWIPKEGDDEIIRKPVAIPTPSKDYTPPKKLPEPTDDWILEF